MGVEQRRASERFSALMAGIAPKRPRSRAGEEGEKEDEDEEDDAGAVEGDSDEDFNIDDETGQVALSAAETQVKQKRWSIDVRKAWPGLIEHGFM